MYPLPWLDEPKHVTLPEADKLIKDLFKHTFSKVNPRHINQTQWLYLLFRTENDDVQVSYKHRTRWVRGERVDTELKLSVPENWIRVEIDARLAKSGQDPKIVYDKQVIATRTGDRVEITPLP